ncbi:hypothetical protein SteCoe_16249 [Stentor coeruleus]|uniref:EF-hand domain-containing protein n=1 Tax=Stentor coeruleus TaxID=5963 RepID=A0A1R2C1L8_9CILI|nr:hypothetical protein SteCoe_16249 [Stentor coeruleus]
MGCTDSKDNLTPEELAIMNGELSLMYQAYQASDVDLVYRKYSNDGIININQWQNVSSKLKLAAYSAPMPPKIQKFYDSLKAENKYKLRDLLVIGIYLSTGKSIDKARLLFEAYDENDAKVLSKGDIQQMTSFIVEVAVEKTCVLIQDDDPNNVQPEEMAKFLQKLRTVKNKGKQELCKMFLGGNPALTELTMEKFVENVTMPSTVQLLTFQGVRKFIKKQEVTASKFAALTSLKKPTGPSDPKAELPKAK